MVVWIVLLCNLKLPKCVGYCCLEFTLASHHLENPNTIVIWPIISDKWRSKENREYLHVVLGFSGLEKPNHVGPFFFIYFETFYQSTTIHRTISLLRELSVDQQVVYRS